eukprot:TRINITY_DN6247_c0_g1_i2.p6 TRINITY_DN6247_c0_g1~~TRINITY_DN6247_c0_g1_i2.p6  ORF type:complete len:189 (+),score=-14.93 TRINITY_DN6247_c0_g1_i2:508-1074(+)
MYIFGKQQQQQVNNGKYTNVYKQCYPTYYYCLLLVYHLCTYRNPRQSEPSIVGTKIFTQFVVLKKFCIVQSERFFFVLFKTPSQTLFQLSEQLSQIIIIYSNFSNGLQYVLLGLTRVYRTNIYNMYINKCVCVGANWVVVQVRIKPVLIIITSVFSCCLGLFIFQLLSPFCLCVLFFCILHPYEVRKN